MPNNILHFSLMQRLSRNLPCRQETLNSLTFFREHEIQYIQPNFYDHHCTNCYCQLLCSHLYIFNDNLQIEVTTYWPKAEVCELSARLDISVHALRSFLSKEYL